MNLICFSGALRRGDPDLDSLRIRPVSWSEDRMGTIGNDSCLCRWRQQNQGRGKMVSDRLTQVTSQPTVVKEERLGWPHSTGGCRRLKGAPNEV